MVLGLISTVLSLARYAFPNSALDFVYSTFGTVIGLVVFVGFILFLVAMYGFSKSYGENKIFNYILYGLIITIIAAVIACVFMFVLFFANLQSLYPNMSSPQQITSDMMTFMAPFMAIFGFITFIETVFTVLSLNLLAAKSQVHMFKTSAKTFLASAFIQVIAGLVFAFWATLHTVSIDSFALFVVPAGLVQYAAWAMLAAAFFKVTVPSAIPINVSSTVDSASVAVVTGQTRYCIYCGTQNSADSLYCTKCGKKL
jgi:uncharacterized membrane protein